MAAGDERRAGGDRAKAARQAAGEAIRADLNRLINPPRVLRTLPKVEARGALPTRRGRADWTGGTPIITGNGVAWPLTEADASAREFWPDKLLSSPDGLIALIIKPIKSITLLDDDDVGGKLELADPAAPPPGP